MVAQKIRTETPITMDEPIYVHITPKQQKAVKVCFGTIAFMLGIGIGIAIIWMLD